MFASFPFGKIPFWRGFQIMLPHSLAAFGIMSFYIYQITVVLPQRPKMPDIEKGYTISFLIDRNFGEVFISHQDFSLIMVTFFLNAVIVLTGFWRLYREGQKMSRTPVP